MSTDSGWGATQPQEPQKPRPKWSVRKTAVAVAIAVGIAGAGGVAIYAASGSAASEDRGGPGMGMGPGGGPPMRMNTRDALHGEFVVSDGNGGYTTELLQTGEVTEISDTAITARSEDGYTKTYTIDADTVIGRGGQDHDSIETGDTVTVVASEDSTAESISERGTMTDSPDGGPAQPAPPTR